MKRMYKQPETEITAVNTQRMMEGQNVSVNEGGGGGGEAGAPARHSTALPVPGGAL